MEILETLELAEKRLRQALDNGVAFGDTVNRGYLLESSIRLTDAIMWMKKEGKAEKKFNAGYDGRGDYLGDNPFADRV